MEKLSAGVVCAAGLRWGVSGDIEPRDGESPDAAFDFIEGVQNPRSRNPWNDHLSPKGNEAMYYAPGNTKTINHAQNMG
jgi:hypothetical protein